MGDHFPSPVICWRLCLKPCPSLFLVCISSFLRCRLPSLSLSRIKLLVFVNIASGLPNKIVVENLVFSSILHQVFFKTDSKFNVYRIGKQNCHIVSAFQEIPFSFWKFFPPKYLKIFLIFYLRFLWAIIAIKNPFSNWN